jgi:hypothetical protein
MAAAKRRLLDCVSASYKTLGVVITRARWQDDSLANIYCESEHWKWENVLLTPDSPDLAIVREQMPLQASQNLISWS